MTTDQQRADDTEELWYVDDDDDDNDDVRRGADKSLARPTSRCRRTESRKTAGFRLNR
jgi:hypothetical protein